MKKEIFLCIGVIFLAWAQGRVAFAQDPATIVGKANRHYSKNDFDQALKFYNQAQGLSPDSPEINFDIGAAQYKKGDYVAAVSSFEKACLTKDKLLESKALYNIANSKYRQGQLKENTDLNSSVELMRGSLDYYKRAIELNPKDKDAKVNHELVEKKLKDILDKLKKQQEENKSQQSKEGQSEEQKQQQDKQEQQGGSSQKEQPQKEEKKNSSARAQPEKENKEQEGQPGQEKQLEEKQAALQKEGEQVKEEGQDGQGQEAQEMSQEEAKMLLDGYRQDEFDQGKLRNTARGDISEAAKDW